jgi:hypothetical protein
LKAVATVKSAFMKELKLDTWQQAEARVPDFAKTDVLKKFQLQKGKPVPNNFKVS